MAKKKKGKERVKVEKATVELRGNALSQAKEILSYGLHGNNLNDLAERLVNEGLLLRLKSGNYRIVAEVEGYAAYVLDSYVTKTRGDVKDTLNYIIMDWAGRHHATLASGGIGLQDPEWQKYLEKHGKKKVK